MHSYRLSRSVVPDRYEIALTPDLAQGRFTGRETVDVTVRESVQEIVLNAADLDIHAVSIKGRDNLEWGGTISLDEENERARLAFPEPIQTGAVAAHDRVRRGLERQAARLLSQHVHRLPTGQGSDGGHPVRGDGCAPRLSLLGRAGIQGGLPGDSRGGRGPLRALEQLRGEHPAHPGEGKVAVTFAPRSRCSTYLLAFVIGRLEATEPAWAGKIPIRVWAVPGKRQLGVFCAGSRGILGSILSRLLRDPYPGRNWT